MKKLLFALAIIAFASCTENTRAKHFGGTASEDVPCDQRVTNITWKEAELWYSTVPMEEDYVPVVHTFREKSGFGMIEGKYLLRESRCK